VSLALTVRAHDRPLALVRIAYHQTPLSWIARYFHRFTQRAALALENAALFYTSWRSACQAYGTGR